MMNESLKMHLPTPSQRGGIRASEVLCIILAIVCA
jgi:hypothetical protein